MNCSEVDDSVYFEEKANSREYDIFSWHDELLYLVGNFGKIQYV